jgi:DNA-binding transcriptional LysR family regulator
VELRHLRYLVAIADEGSFSRAAMRMHVAQQALSRQIADLEHELGVRLFERHARGARLTSRGAAFVEDARLTLAHTDRAVLRVRGMGEESQESVRVAYTPAGRTEEHLACLLHRFGGAFPRMAVQCDPMKCEMQHRALEDHDIDVALTFVAPETDRLSKAVAWILSFDHVVLPAGHPLASQEPLRLADLESSAMLWSPREPYQSILAELAERGIRPNFATFRVSRTSAALVAITRAWALIPGECPPDSGAVARRFEDPPIPVRQWVVWRCDETSEPVHRFIAACRATGAMEFPLGWARPFTMAAGLSAV